MLNLKLGMLNSKKEIAFQFILFPVLFLLWHLLYPETLAGIEEYSFFVCTPDYITLMLSKPGGLGILTGNFLSQFYRWREIGSTLQAVYPFFILGIYNYLLFRFNKKEGIWIAVLLILPFILTQLHWLNVGFSIQYILFMASIALYLFIKQTHIRRLVFILMPFVLLLFMPAGFVFLFYLIAIFFEYYFYGKRIKSLLWPVLGFIISGILLYFWNRQWFIPKDERLFYPAEYSICLTIILYCSPLLLLLGTTFIRFRGKWLNTAITIIAATFLIVLFYTDTSAREKEMLRAIEHDAIVSDRDKLLSRIHPEAAANNPLYLRYTLLALSEKGELPNHLFALNPSPDCFYFYRSKEQSHEYFNSFFYASLDIYNEAVRQAFEAALINEAGMNFRTLRLLTDWFLKMGNKPLTEKYLAILRHSTCHSAWIQRREILLDELKQKQPLTPDKSKNDIFIGSYPFAIEMWELLNDDPDNLRKQEYFLCALLLNKELKQFETALSGLPYLQRKQPLPLCFQEALSILYFQQISDIPDKYHLSHQLLQNHETFKQIFSSQSKEAVTAQFKGSYWLYYYE